MESEKTESINWSLWLWLWNMVKRLTLAEGDFPFKRQDWKQWLSLWRQEEEKKEEEEG